MVTFLRNGKALYIEGNDFLYDHLSTDFTNMLKCQYVEDGTISYRDISTISGQRGTFLDMVSFNFPVGEPPNYRPDVIKENGGILLLTSQDQKGRVVAYDDGPLGYHVITSSIIFGALADGADSNNKTELMKRYMNFLFGRPANVASEAPEPSPDECALLPNYPNPFNASTVIPYEINKDIMTPVSVEIYNALGQLTKTLVHEQTGTGSYMVSWDGTDDTNRLLQSGLYVCVMRAGHYRFSRKLLLVR